MQVEICKCCGKPKKKVIGRGVGYSEGRVPMRQLGAGGMGRDNEDRFITAPATPAAAEWDGWGTALKPAWEPIIVARKPLQGTVAENVQRYGTGAMNIDGCRIETTQQDADHTARPNSKGKRYGEKFSGTPFGDGMDSTCNGYDVSQGRWPANLIHDGSAEVLAGFPMTTSGYGVKSKGGHSIGMLRGADAWKFEHDGSYYAGDTGSAARFFYCAKASKQDRDEGCEDVPLHDPIHGKDNESGGLNVSNACIPSRNHHPTVKPTALMRYLCRLVTPPQGVILDPFMGSGSTGKAAILEGFNFVGVDTEIEYVEIAARRIEHACEKVGIVVEQPMMFETKRETVDRPKQLILL